MKKWKIDYDANIIYLSSSMSNSDILDFINDISSSEHGLQDGPNKKWIIITTQN